MPQEFVFESLFFYKRTPCYYKVYFSGNEYFGIPVPHHFYNKIEFPFFIVRIIKGSIQVKGITDEPMVYEILREFEKQHTIDKAFLAL